MLRIIIVGFHLFVHCVADSVVSVYPCFAPIARLLKVDSSFIVFVCINVSCINIIGVAFLVVAVTVDIDRLIVIIGGFSRSEEIACSVGEEIARSCYARNFLDVNFGGRRDLNGIPVRVYPA